MVHALGESINETFVGEVVDAMKLKVGEEGQHSPEFRAYLENISVDDTTEKNLLFWAASNSENPKAKEFIEIYRRNNEAFQSLKEEVQASQTSETFQSQEVRKAWAEQYLWKQTQHLERRGTFEVLPGQSLTKNITSEDITQLSFLIHAAGIEETVMKQGKLDVRALQEFLKDTAVAKAYEAYHKEKKPWARWVDGILGKNVLLSLQEKTGNINEARRIETETPPEASEKPENPPMNENIEMRFGEKQQGVSIIAENTTEIIDIRQLSDPLREFLDRHEKSGTIIQHMTLIMGELAKKNNAKYGAAQKTLEDKIATIDPSNAATLETSIAECITYIESLKQQLNISIDLADEYEVLKYIRDLDYGVAENILTEKLFLRTQISEEALEYFINNPLGSNEQIKNLTGKKYNDIVNTVIKKTRDIRIEMEKQETQTYFIEQIMQQNSLSQEEAQAHFFNEYRDLIQKSVVAGAVKGEILEAYIRNNDNYTKNIFGRYVGEDKLLQLYGTIRGIGHLSDKAFDWGVEGVKIVGTEIIALVAGALSGGIAFAAVNAAFWGTRAVKGATYLQKIYSATSKGARLGQWTAGTVGRGLAFGTGYNTIKGLAGAEDAFSGRSFVNSMAYMGAFRALQSLRALPQLQNVLQFKNGVARFTKNVVIDGATLNAVGMGLNSDIIFEEGEWGQGEMIQAFILAAFLRGGASSGSKSLFFRNPKTPAPAVKPATPKARPVATPAAREAAARARESIARAKETAAAARTQEAAARTQEAAARTQEAAAKAAAKAAATKAKAKTATPAAKAAAKTTKEAAARAAAKTKEAATRTQEATARTKEAVARAREAAAKSKAKPAATPKAKPAATPKAKPAATPKAKPAAKAKVEAEAGKVVAGVGSEKIK